MYQGVSKNQHHLLCTCVDYPSGHILTKSSYYQYLNQLQRRWVEPTSIENLDSKTYPTFGHNLDNTHFSNSEQSDTLNETLAERGNNLELALVDEASDIDDNLQEEDLQEENLQEEDLQEESLQEEDLQEEDLEEEDLQEENDPEVSFHH